MLKALKVLTAVMGVMIIILFAVIVVEIIHRIQDPEAGRSAEATGEAGGGGADADGSYATSIDVPADGALVETHAAGDHLVLAFQMPDGATLFKVVDARTGEAAGSIAVPAARIDAVQGEE